MGVPVFSDNADIKSWRELSMIEKGPLRKNTFRSKERFERILSEFGDSNEMNPWIASKVLDLIMRLPIDNKSREIQKVVRRCRASDSIPKIKAVSFLMELSEFDIAASVMDGMSVRNNISQWEYWRGLICKETGDLQSAISHFIRSYDANSTFMPVLSELESLTMDDTWTYRKDIESIFMGNDVVSTSEVLGCPMENLREIYRESILSGYEQAISSLKGTIGYASGDIDHILAMARFLHRRCEYQASIDEYLKIKDGHLSISLELVSVYIDAGMFRNAIELCKELESIGPGDRRLIESFIRIYAKEEDRADMTYYMEMYRCEDYADSDGYVMMIRLMMPLSMYTSVNQLIRLMEVSGVDETITSVLSSENDYAANMYTQALASISKALKKDPRNLDYKIQKMRALAAMNDPKVMADVNDILRNDPHNIQALNVKKEILLKNKDYESALKVCDEMREIYPDDANIVSDIATIYGDMGRTEESIRAYRESLGMRTDPSLFMSVIKRLVSDGKYEEAVSIIGEYDDSYGMIPGSWILRGNSEYALRRYSDAVESYDRALELDHDDHRVWHSRGMAAEAIRDYEKAESSYDRAILLDLDNEEYWISKSIVQEKNGDYSGAIRSLNRVIDEHPENSYVLMKKAYILSRLDKNKEAMIFIELALKIEPSNLDILRAKRDLCVRDKDIDAADEVCRKMIRYKPNDDSLRLEEARILCDSRRYTKALNALDGMHDPNTLDALKVRRTIHIAEGPQNELIRTCNLIHEKEPNDRENMMILARAYDDAGKKNEALKIYDLLKESNPEDKRAAIGSAMMTEDQESALKVINDSLKDDPNNIDLLFDASDILLSSGRYHDAEAYMSRAVDAEPDSPDPYIRRSRLQMKYGLYNEAILTMEDAMKSVIMQDPEMWICLGDAQMEIGNNADALTSYNNALEMDDAYKGIHTKCGLAQLALGLISEAQKSFETAYELNERDIMAMSQLAMIHMDEGKMNVALRYIKDSLAVDQFFGPALVADVKYHVMNSDFDKAKEIVDTIGMHGGVDPKYVQTMRRMLVIVPEEKEPDEDSESVEIESYARALIQKSYESESDVSDPAVALAASIPSDMVDKVLSYLSDIEPFGAIVPGTPDFERMEKLSHDAIVKGEMEDIGEKTLIPLYSAVFDSGAESVDEGKRLISYIYEVLTINMDPAEYDKGISTIVSHMVNVGLEQSIYLIMERYDVGVFAARTAYMLYERERDSVVGHI